MLREEITRGLGLERDGERSTRTCLSVKDRMTTAIAFRAALLFQVTHRFLSNTQRERRIDCPAVTEYNGTDLARYKPPPNYVLGCQMPIQTLSQARISADQHSAFCPTCVNLYQVLGRLAEERRSRPRRSCQRCC